ncbi:abhydrolase domain-containing protein [Stagonosporopsis vannaccii]|nr:abhydrolase domain-containing protein [Stagonosporopsis vannaccii]
MGIGGGIAVALSFISCIWLPATLLCCLPWVQKQMLYLHWVTMFPGRWLEEPERAGYLKNQVTPFYIATKDGHRLFTWLVAPLGVYARKLNDFVHEQPGVKDVTERLAFRLLQDDPEARLLIYFHGNAATLGQQRRTEEYRSYASGACEKVFVLAFDYRGFGMSSGEPSEVGLRNDAEAVVDWALNVAKIAPERILLLGHSLGTAVSAAVALQYAEMGVEFAGIILCAAFTNAGNAFASYSIGGVIPVLAPVKMIPAIQNWFSRKIREPWRTDVRLAALTRTCSKLRLVFIHAEDDGTMPWDQTEELVASTLKAATEPNADDDASTAPTPKYEVVDLGEAGMQEIWETRTARIEKIIAKHGDHNQMMTWSPIALAILQTFGLTAATTRL